MHFSWLAPFLVLVVACAPSGGDEDDCDSSEACAQASGVSTTPPPFAVSDVRAARYPILLHHGFNASSTNSWSFFKVKEALEADGNDVTTSQVEPFNGVPARAATLAGIVDDVRTGFCKRHPSGDAATCERNTKVNIIAHSMGGLDARYLASTLGYAPKIASITTISTPHGGSNIADVGLKLTPDGGTLGAVLDLVAKMFGRTFTDADLANNTSVHAALSSLAEANAPAFNRANPDQASVYYQSYAGVSRAIGGPRTDDGRREVLDACNQVYFGDLGRADFMPISLAAGSAAVGRFTSVPQDGMVTVANAKWGTFRGCFPADHLQEVGQEQKDGPDAYTLFDHIAFYRVVASDLAKRRF